jgi:hypothetical protein
VLGRASARGTATRVAVALSDWLLAAVGAEITAAL